MMPNKVECGLRALRERYFIDHNSDSQTFITEEYTIQAKEKDLDNIIIIEPRFLPNLKIYDSDGEQLSLLSRELTTALFDQAKKVSTGQERTELEEYCKKIRKGDINALWIKLPPSKKLQKDQVTTIRLEYEAPERKEPFKELELKFPAVEKQELFYTIIKPEDYDFKNINIDCIARTKDGLETQSVEKKGDDEFSIKTKEGKDEFFIKINFDSMVMARMTRDGDELTIRYSFKPDKKVTSLISIYTIGLIIFPSFIIFAKMTHGFLNPYHYADDLISHQIDIGLGTVAASLALPALVNDQSIRLSLRRKFFIPLILGIIMMFI